VQGTSKRHVVFESGGEIYTRGASIGGSWENAVRISTGTENSSAPCVTERDGTLFSVWQEDNSVQDPAWDVVFSYSSDGGETWQSPVIIGQSTSANPPQPVIIAGTPDPTPLTLMAAYQGVNGLYYTLKTSEPGGWSTPALVTGTSASSRNQSLTYRSTSPGYYKIVWDEPDGSNGKILFSNWNGTGWVNQKQVNEGTIGTIIAEAKPTISLTASNALDIAWQGVKSSNGNGAIVHNRNLSQVYNIFEIPLVATSSATMTGHSGSSATLIWQAGSNLYRAKYNGTSWTSVTTVGSGSYPSTSITNPPGGNARLVWTQGSEPIYSVYLHSAELNKIESDNSIEVHREVVVRDTSSDAYVSFELSSLMLSDNGGVTQGIEFIPVYDTVSYTPEEFLSCLETESFIIPSGVTTVSVTRSILGRTPSRFFSQANARFEIVNVTTGEVVSSFGSRQLSGLDSNLSISDSLTFSVRRLPPVTYKVRTVIEDLDVSDPALRAVVMNIFICNDVEPEIEKISASTLPATHVLSQNFPNPFNPTTTIKYELANDSHVSLKLYDVLGREVLTLVNRDESEGPHQVFLNASELSSGVYFYRLKAGDFTDTRRLLLLK
jgi:hypothetical protein